MDDFCGSEFWNTSITWEADNPDLTPCFQQTVLVYVPCAFLWLFTMLEIYYIKNSGDRNIPRNFLNQSKLFLTAALTILTIIDLVYAISSDGGGRVYPVHFYTPAIKIASFILSGVLIHFNRLHGIRTSGLLFIFWFMLTVLSIPRLRTELRGSSERAENGDENSFDHYNFISFMIFFPTSALLTFLNCFVDSEANETKYPKVDKPCPELGASFLSKIFFRWFDSFIWLGYRRPLENGDLWHMKPEDTSTEVTPRFLKYWNKSVAKNSQIEPAPAISSATFKKSSASVNFATAKTNKPASILPALIKAFGGTFLFGSCLKLFQDVLTFASPQVLRMLINFIEGGQPAWRGYLYAGLLFGIASTQTLFLAQYFHRMFIVGLRIRTALISAIFRKALVMSNSARKESTVGEIVNLMAVDAQRFMDLVTYLNMIWSAPLQISLAIYFLWGILGPSVLAGLAVMIILIPVNGVIANKAKNLQIRQMKNKDERVKLMNEVLNGMKVLKLYAWEPSFEKQVLKIRDKEVHVLKQAAYLNAGTSFIWSCAPFLVSLVTFATYVMSSEENILTPTRAFVCLTLFDMIRMPLALLPLLIVYMIETSVSVTRINKFMNGEELDPNNVQHDDSEKNPLLIENGTFTWGDEVSVLKNINLQVGKGKCVAVVGTVGSGKSSLVSAFLGEMDKVSGRVNTVGKIAYVPQQAWIQNATLQENILFGRPMDLAKYNNVIQACALKPDLEILPGGDQTEIGEKGINLSGGQKQRVSLARAVYNDSDIYFLDDPLSAVDSHVGKHIFEQVLGPKGILAKKTRVLVTHGITYLPEVDNIFVLKYGEVSEQGTYKELMAKKGDFADFLIQHLTEVNAEEEDLDEIKAQLEEVASDDLKAKLERAISTTRSRSDSQSESQHGELTRRSSTISETGSLRKRTPDKKTSESDKQDDKPVQNGGGNQKLIETEKAETGSVKWDVYKHYLKSIGWTLSIATVILNMIFQTFSIGSNVWLSEWSSDKEAANDTGKRNMYLGVYASFGLGQVVAQFIVSLTFSLGTIAAANGMHSILLSAVLRLPMTFFDVTPLGRILNRFSKDVDTCDNVLPHVLRMFIAMVFGVSFIIYIDLLLLLYLFTTFIATLALYIGTLRAAQNTHNYLLTKMLRAPMEFFDQTPIGRIINRFSKDIEAVDTLSSMVSDLAPRLATLRASQLLHVTLLWAMMRAPLMFYDQTPIGRILSRFSSDVEATDNKIPEIVSDGIWCFFEVIATLAVISISTPLFLFVIVPISILYYFVQRFYVATSRQLKRLESVSRSPIYSHFGESITGAQTIRAYTVQPRFIHESENKVDFNQICYYPSIIANRWLAVRLEMVGNLIILFAALFAVMSDSISPGFAGLSVTYALQVTQTLNWLVRMTSDVETNIVAVERIKEYGETKQEAAWENNTPLPVNWPENGRVEFRNFQVRYREGLDLVLRGISFIVEGGEKVGIVGRTGAGKSSLTLALFRIIESAGGDIIIDGENISKLGLHALRSRLTIIPQDPVLFSGTLRLNLDPFDTHTDDEIWRALEHAHLKAFVKGLAAGINHEVTEGGENLSVGQRQLVCLARALLRKTKVLILDEATAAVDLETDDLIQKTIREEFKECTVLVIAHRLNTILDSDKVIVLDKGTISEFASPTTLLQNRQSAFYSMAKDAVISISTPLFLFFVLPISILYNFVQRYYVATSRQLKRLESVTRSPIYSHFGESITGAQTIRAYNIQPRFIHESENKVDFNQICYYPSIIANRWLAVRLEMIGNLIILFAAMFAVMSDSLSPEFTGLSVTYALQVTQTLNCLVRMTSEVETNIVAVERLKEYGETKQEAAWENNTPLPVNWPENGRVEFRNFQVRYREGLDLVLRGISFIVEGGEKVGIVGRTGAGKSSLTLALFRIIESAGGDIIIDGENISKLGLHALRSRLTIIPQDPVLFSGTLRLNLDPFDTHTDDEIWRALEHAHLKAFVKGLAAGINHEVTEGGENLSVGQRQLVCLSRALLRKTKVLILDEATAAVDLETDDLIQKTIREEFKECTVLVIAHRLNTILDSDKVIVLDKGTISEFASPTTLLQNRQSAFYSMAKDAEFLSKMLEQQETSSFENSLRFVKNEFDDQINEIINESKQESLRAPFKIVLPYPGMCIKAFKTGSKEKFFINICHTSEIPAPKDISEKELHKLIETQNATEFKVPLSVTKPRVGKDKSGNDVEISDVAINTEFYTKKIKRSDGLFYHFLITLVFESLEQKYQIVIDTTNFILLKNRACIDKLVEHQIYNRDVKTVESYHNMSENIEKLGSDESDQIKIGLNDQPKSNGKVLIEEISTQNNFTARKSISNDNEPEHRLVSDTDEFNRSILIGEFYLPEVRNIDEVTLEANDDRLMLEAKKYGYSFDGFLPQDIVPNKTQAEFDSDRMILKITMTCK
ncbi:CLUMA_CG013703, isoform B [Clunio marinus]|uniref:ABC-type glutathione-S-conjugate transporter n=1 Tax=Clunio marinus TaxID=568069 RepID=A0A1J1IMX1_9DIPT|nr:CLUMA_CG013703, isoform B [Clunio marinus]